jgi:hypothetical protein
MGDFHFVFSSAAMDGVAGDQSYPQLWAFDWPPWIVHSSLRQGLIWPFAEETVTMMDWIAMRWDDVSVGRSAAADAICIRIFCFLWRQNLILVR